MNDNDINRLIQAALNDESALPEGLSERLEQRIDQLAANDAKRIVYPTQKKRSLYWLSGIAASLLIGLVFFFQVEQVRHTPLADTYNDPAEAAMIAEEALIFLSTQLNKGMNQVAEAGKEVDRVNTIINKQFNSLDTEE